MKVAIRTYPNGRFANIVTNRRSLQVQLPAKGSAADGLRAEAERLRREGTRLLTNAQFLEQAADAAQGS